MQRGFDLPTSKRVIGSVPVVASRGITGYHNESKVKGPGVVIGRSGSIGGGQFLSNDFWPLNTTLWVKDFKNHNRRFIYYLLKNIDFTTFNAGSSVPTLNKNHLSSIFVPLFSLETEREIANILSAYDDLVENNQIRIELLEKAAHLLYKEWFVNLRFPGHEHTKTVDGVPEGWEEVSFSNIATFMNGYAFKPADLGSVGYPIVKIPELRNGPTLKTPRNTGETIPNKYVISNGDLLFSWSGTLLVNIWNHGPALLNQHLFKVTPNYPDLRSFVFLALKNSLSSFYNQTTGATMKHIRKGALESVTIPLPSPLLLRQFEDFVSDILQQISILEQQITKLKEARDLLLPKLMSGEISV